jgi:hypothetical protein
MRNLIEYKEGESFISSTDWQNNVESDGRGEAYGFEFFGSGFADFGSGAERATGYAGFIEENTLEQNHRFAVRLEETEQPPSNGFYLSVERINEDYYRHEKSKSAQNYDDLFSEPVQIYSHVEGGYGIVGTSSPLLVWVNTP